MPKVSVALPVHNGASFVCKALESVLTQSFTDFEVIAIDDGSTDDSRQILESFAARDARVKVFTQEKQGLTATLNRACALATGEFIARQDADDVSFKDRFLLQVRYLEERSKVLMCGTWSWVVHPVAGVLGSWEFPDSSELLYRLLVHQLNPFIHGSVMFRTESFKRLPGGYRFGDVAQDLDLWIRMGEQGLLGMVESVQFAYFLSPGSITEQQNDLIRLETEMIRRLQTERVQRGREGAASEQTACKAGAPGLASGELGWYGAAVYRLLAGDNAAFRSYLSEARRLNGKLRSKALLLMYLSYLPRIVQLFYRLKMGERLRYIRFFRERQVLFSSLTEFSQTAGSLAQGSAESRA